MSLHISIIAPDRTVWDSNAEEVILPSSTGQLGILRGHAPLLTALDIGVMRVRTDKEWTPIVLMGGFGLVKDDRITLLVNEAELGSSVEPEQATTDFEEAKTTLADATTRKERVEANLAFKRARARYQAVTQA